MSSRSKKSSSTPSYTTWSEWEWNEHHKCESRYRQNTSTGELKYEYRQVQLEPQTPRNKNADPPPLDTIHESGQQGYTQESYTYDVASATRDLARTSINTEPKPSYSYGGANQKTAFNPYSRISTENEHTTVDLDPHFTVHGAWEFKFGRVFKVLWSEPTGSGGTELTGVRIQKAKFGEDSYHSIRRFVIVDPRNGHCICLPILTYGGQGTCKRGVHAEDHAVIYTDKPNMRKGEKIKKSPIKVTPDSPRHKLDSASRINYAKLYTVEYNVKVFFVGAVHRRYEQQVVVDYNSTHRPLPDRPVPPGSSADTYGHAEGVNPTPYYPATVISSQPQTSQNQHSMRQPQTPAYPITSTSSYSNQPTPSSYETPNPQPQLGTYQPDHSSSNEVYEEKLHEYDDIYEDDRQR